MHDVALYAQVDAEKQVCKCVPPVRRRGDAASVQRHGGHHTAGAFRGGQAWSNKVKKMTERLHYQGLLVLFLPVFSPILDNETVSPTPDNETVSAIPDNKTVYVCYVWLRSGKLASFKAGQPPFSSCHPK